MSCLVRVIAHLTGTVMDEYGLAGENRRGKEKNLL
jgi:hypothetical protein